MKEFFSKYQTERLDQKEREKDKKEPCMDQERRLDQKEVLVSDRFFIHSFSV
jgi:hypothetical protein